MVLGAEEMRLEEVIGNDNGGVGSGRDAIEGGPSRSMAAVTLEDAVGARRSGLRQ